MMPIAAENSALTAVLHAPAFITPNRNYGCEWPDCYQMFSNFHTALMPIICSETVNSLQNLFTITNRKLVCELLLVVYGNFHRITHRFRDTSCFNAELKTTFLPTPQNLKVMPLKYGDEIWPQKTRIMGLPCGKEVMIQSRSVTDRPTDGQIYDD